MSKWAKRLLGVAAIGGAIAGIVHLINKDKCCCDTDDEFADDFENEDFDLDEDLEPATNREYVPLTPNAEETTKAAKEEKSEEPKKEEKEEKKTEDSPAEEKKNEEKKEDAPAEEDK